MGKEVYAQIACVPKRVSKVNSILKQEENDPRGVFISHTCFSGLLFVRPQTVKVDPILCLIRQWDRSRECFVLDGGHEWVFTDENVALVYGLPHGFGKSPIQIDSKYDHYTLADEFVQKHLTLLVGKKYIKHNVLEGLLLSDSINIGADCSDYWRFYVLYALCSMLIPLSSSSISHRYLKFLESPEIAESYNWAGLVKDKLVEGLNAYKSKMDRDDAPNARPTGDLHCLMHLFYDFLHSRHLVGRCYTCAIERDLNFQDLQKVFPHLNGLKEEIEGKGKGTMMIKGPQQGHTEDEFLRKKEKYEKEIVRCDDLIEKCAKKKEHIEACLKKLLEDHSGGTGGEGEGMESANHERLSNDDVGDVPNSNEQKVAEIPLDSQLFSVGAGLRNDNVEDVPTSNGQMVAESSADSRPFSVDARIEDLPNLSEQKHAEISSGGQPFTVGAGLNEGADVRDPKRQRIGDTSLVEQTVVDCSLHSSLSMNITRDLAANSIPEI